MKKLLNVLTVLSIFSLIVFMSCNGSDDDDDGPDTLTPEQEQAARLVGAAWTLTPAGASGVTLDGAPAEGWNNFTLTFTGNENGGNFSTTNAVSPLVWPTSGSWQFQNGVTTLLRSDGVPMTVNVTETQLTLSFTIVDEGGGATQGFGGNWSFGLARPQ